MTRDEFNNSIISQSLKHHGILGQKWGHKAGPPYPLDAEDHTAAEKKAGYTDSLAKKHADTWKKHRNDKLDASPSEVMLQNNISGHDKYLKITESLSNNKEYINKCNSKADKILNYSEQLKTDKYSALCLLTSNEYFRDQDSNSMQYIAEGILDVSQSSDLDQGSFNNSFCYIKYNNLLNEARKCTESYEKAKSEYEDNCKAAVDNLLGKYGKSPIYKESTYSVSEDMTSRMMKHDLKWSQDQCKKLSDIVNINSGNDKSKVDLSFDKAKKIVDKIDFDNGSADKLLNAVNTLKYNDVKVSDMTDDMWDAINKEMRK